MILKMFIVHWYASNLLGNLEVCGYKEALTRTAQSFPWLFKRFRGDVVQSVSKRLIQRDNEAWEKFQSGNIGYQTVCKGEKIMGKDDNAVKNTLDDIYGEPQIDADGVNVALQEALDQAEVELSAFFKDTQPKLKQWLETWRAKGLPESELRGVIQTNLINFEKTYL
jgi:hypothetical protein